MKTTMKSVKKTRKTLLKEYIYSNFAGWHSFFQVYGLNIHDANLQNTYFQHILLQKT